MHQKKILKTIFFQLIVFVFLTNLGELWSATLIMKDSPVNKEETLLGYPDALLHTYYTKNSPDQDWIFHRQEPGKWDTIEVYNGVLDNEFYFKDGDISLSIYTGATSNFVDLSDLRSVDMGGNGNKLYKSSIVGTFPTIFSDVGSQTNSASFELNNTNQAHTGNITFNNNNGSSNLRINSSSITGILNMTGNASANINLQSNSVLNSNDSVINAGTGNDNILISGNSTMSVKSISTGGGNDSISATDNSSLTTIENLDLGGGGNKTLNLQKSSNVTINQNLILGSAASHSQINLINISNSTLSSQEITMTGANNNLTLDSGNLIVNNNITMSGGKSEINLNGGSYQISSIKMDTGSYKTINSSIDGTTSIEFINNHSEKANFSLISNNFSGTISYSGGQGNTYNQNAGTFTGVIKLLPNTLALDIFISGGEFRSNSNLNIGNNQITIAGSSLNPTAYLGNLDLGNGENTIIIADNSMIGSASGNIGQYSITTGSGNDRFYLASSTFYNTATLNAGDGNNIFDIYAGGKIYSLLKSGSGQDTFNIHNARDIDIIDAGVVNQNTENNIINIMATQGVTKIGTIKAANTINIKAQNSLYISKELAGHRENKINVSGENSIFWLQKTTSNKVNSGSLFIDQGGMAIIDSTTLVGDAVVTNGSLIGHSDAGKWTNDGNVELGAHASITPFRSRSLQSKRFLSRSHNDDSADAASFRISGSTIFNKGTIYNSRFWSNEANKTIDGHKVYTSDYIYTQSATWNGQAELKTIFQNLEYFDPNEDYYYIVLESINEFTNLDDPTKAFNLDMVPEVSKFSDFSLHKSTDNKNLYIHFKLSKNSPFSGNIATHMTEPNAIEAARVLDILRQSGSLPLGFHDFFSAMRLAHTTDAALQNDIRQIHAEPYATLPTITMNGLRQFRNIREQRTSTDLTTKFREENNLNAISNINSNKALAAISENEVFKSKDFSFWTTAYSSREKQNKVRTEYGYKLDDYGLAMGIRKDFSNFYTSFAGGYVHRNIDWKVINAHANNNNFIAQGIVGIETSRAFAELIGEYSYNKNKLSREIIVGNYNSHAGSKYHENIYGAGARAGYTFVLANDVLVIPTVAVYYDKSHTPSITESGSAGALNLQVDKVKYHNIETPIGIKVNKSFFLSEFTLTPEVRGEITGIFGDKRGRVISNFTGDPSRNPFESIGVNMGKYQARVGSGIEIAKSSSFSTSINYDYTFARKLNSHNVSINIGLSF